MTFAMPKFTNTQNQSKDFPTMAEASKGKPEKDSDKKSESKEEPLAGFTDLPKFTNKKKADTKPIFAKLEETKEHKHEGELVSEPYSGQNREFKVAGADEKKDYKSHHKGARKFGKKGEYSPVKPDEAPHKEPSEPKEKIEHPKKEAPRKDSDKKEVKKEKPAPKVDGKKPKKAGDSVAVFTVDAPAEVFLG